QAPPHPGAHQARPGAAPDGQGCALPDPRQPRGRAQDVRPRQRPPQLPVLEALISQFLRNPRRAVPRRAALFRPTFSSVALTARGATIVRETPKRAASEEDARWRTTPRSGRSDRKSTRLNSSHVKISYAVFCLKKKIYPRTPCTHTTT